MFSEFKIGRVAQLVEQRTENPCVGGSIPSPATNILNSIPKIISSAQLSPDASVGLRPSLPTVSAAESFRKQLHDTTHKKTNL
jgi:hypothetical protein